MKIAVDFDGTLVEDNYPKIGKDIPFAFQSLKLLIKEGHCIVLWTSRVGEKLEEAVSYCKRRGIEFYSVNKNFIEEDENDGFPRKIIADCYIDSRNVFAKIDWKLIACKVLNKKMSYIEEYI
jgi:hydroxymethylpyrimidine pyrophosphatase-like HAD family hydrolase